MKCIECKTRNVSQATYCINCGYEFTKKEKEIASKKDFWARVYKIKEKIDFLTFGSIKDKWYVRVLLLLISIGGGIYLFYINGSTMKVIKSDDYQVQQKKHTNEYLITTKKEVLPLNLYFPHTPKKITVDCYNDKKEKISSKKYSEKEVALYLKENPTFCEVAMNKKNKVILYPKKEVE